MHPLHTQYMVEQHRQALLREAEQARLVDSLYPDAQEKVLRKRISYVLLGLAHSHYDTQQLYSEQAYRDAYARTKAIVRTVGFAALGVGVLVGGWLSSSIGLLVPVLFGSVVCLMISVPMVIRLFIILRGQML